MRKTLLAIWLLLPVVAFSQNTPPIGDVYQSGTPQPVEQAFQKLYQITAQITANPSSFYLKAQADKSNWPTVDQAQAQWDNATLQAGTALTQDQRNSIVPCAAHLNAAISDMERGYQIHITQSSNASAQSEAQALYSEGKTEFAKCLSTGVATDAGGTSPNTGAGTLGSPQSGTQGTPQSASPPSKPSTKPTLTARITNEPDQQEPAPSKPTPGPTKPTPAPTNPANNTIQYMQGMAAGMGNCIQGLGSVFAGLGYFAQGDFTDAAKAWGVTAGDSVTLKAIYAELTTPIVGSSVTAYDQGTVAGRRICQYAAVPAATKALGPALKSAATKTGTALAKTPLSGGALQEAINDAPKSIANEPVQLQNGAAQLGDYVDKGSFADVYKFGKASVIKLSRTDVDAAGYGPASIQGQFDGYNLLKEAGIDGPELSNFQPGNEITPASVVADDVTKKYPGSFQLSNKAYNKMLPAQQAKIVSAIQEFDNQLTAKGLGSVDPNPSNLTMQPVGDGFKAILHDTDMIFNRAGLQQLVNGGLPNGLIPKGVLEAGLELGGAPNLLKEPWTLESVMETLQNARMNRLLPPPIDGRVPTIPPVMNTPGDTLPPSGAVPR